MPVTVDDINNEGSTVKVHFYSIQLLIVTHEKILNLVSFVLGGPRPVYQEATTSDDEDLRFISSWRNITHDVTWEDYIAEAFGTALEQNQDEFDEDTKFHYGSGDYSGSGWASGDESENAQASELVGQLFSD